MPGAGTGPRATAPREFYQRITAPALNMGGWYDLFLKGTLSNFLGMKDRGGSEQARQRQRLVVGPWAHGPLSGWYPERSFGLMSGTDAADITGLQLRWFGALLKGEEGDAEAGKPVRLFVMGTNVWRDEDDWPLPDTTYVDYFLHSGGRANTADGDGSLPTDVPGEQPDDVFVYDPNDPVPTTGGPTFLPGLFIGANAGPRDQRAVEQRPDVLCYTTLPLPEPLEVTGPVELLVHVWSSAADSDVTAKLVDVHPDGRAENLCEGILRVRYRTSMSTPELMEPGRVYELRVDLVATANVFAAGTGSAWKCRAATSRGSTATPTPAARSPMRPSRTCARPPTGCTTRPHTAPDSSSRSSAAPWNTARCPVVSPRTRLNSPHRDDHVWRPTREP